MVPKTGAWKTQHPGTMKRPVDQERKGSRSARQTPRTEPTAHVSRGDRLGALSPRIRNQTRTPARALAAPTGLDAPVRATGKKEAKGVHSGRK